MITASQIFSPGVLPAQHKGLVDTDESMYARMLPVGIGDMTWTEGFWADWYSVCRDVMVPGMMGNYLNDQLSHGFANFEIAAGLKSGHHEGPPFHDGDFYKILEAMIMINAMERDPETECKLDSMITVIAAAQREDGYIHTPVIIEQQGEGDHSMAFRERLDFETYNMGHLMTAACLYYRTTGKENLLTVAKGAADFLYEFYRKRPSELAQNAVCPSHYMGITELYRTTGDDRYLELARGLIDIRSEVKDGTDHNQDRIPFRQQHQAVGHAVRANYLYAGVADVYAETGDDSLMDALDKIWHDVTERKLYITGGCGALYDGVSPNGTTYDQSYIQQVHQAYGQDFELPNLDAHNESCANIGFLLWNWRMFQVTGEARYVDMLEKVAYNSLLAGVSLDGTGYFYTNPLAVSKEIPYNLRWSKVREPYISLCNCCPPNTIRTIAEMNNYACSLSGEGLWINLYGSGTLQTVLKNAGEVQLDQETDYPWDGRIALHLREVPGNEFSIFLRIPGWSREPQLTVNGENWEIPLESGSYVQVRRTWKSGDEVVLDLGMEPFLVQSNPLVEENQNLVAFQRGPVVYCLESAGLPEEVPLSEVLIPVTSEATAVPMKIGEQEMAGLELEARVINDRDWDRTLYRRVDPVDTKKIRIRLIPYYAWGNRGEGDMSVWLPADW
ncbi:MAG: aceric acid hydrolase [Bacteroidales bacterium]